MEDAAARASKVVLRQAGGRPATAASAAGRTVRAGMPGAGRLGLGMINQWLKRDAPGGQRRLGLGLGLKTKAPLSLKEATQATPRKAAMLKARFASDFPRRRREDDDEENDDDPDEDEPAESAPVRKTRVAVVRRASDGVVGKGQSRAVRMASDAPATRTLRLLRPAAAPAARANGLTSGVTKPATVTRAVASSGRQKAAAGATGTPAAAKRVARGALLGYRALSKTSNADRARSPRSPSPVVQSKAKAAAKVPARGGAAATAAAQRRKGPAAAGAAAVGAKRAAPAAAGAGARQDAKTPQRSGKRPKVQSAQHVDDSASVSSSRSSSSGRGDPESDDGGSSSSSPVEVVAHQENDLSEGNVEYDKEFQDAILEYLRPVCGEHEDAQVLAEYIVVLVTGKKTREEIIQELSPFFDSKALVPLVEWVEATKSRYTRSAASSATASAAAPASSTKARLTPAAGMDPPSPAAGRSPRLAPLGRASAAATSPAGAARKAVATSPATRPALFGAPPPMAATPLAAGGVFASAPPKAASGVANAKQNKNELLEVMTRQLQQILAKLGDKALSDEQREKYQSIAQTIQTQMAKLSNSKQSSTGSGWTPKRR